MRLGIISDIHSNVYGLNSVMMELRNCDTILCAGDITGYYAFVNEVFEVLDRYNIQFIRGNHDGYLFQKDTSAYGPIKKRSVEYTEEVIFKENLHELRKAKLQYNRTIDGIKIKMYHGSPWNKLEEYVYPDYPDFERFNEIEADLIILGHTHHPMIKRVGDMLIVNPGSCGQPRDRDPRASCMVFDSETGKAAIRRAKYDMKKVCESVKENGFDSKLVEVLEKPFKKDWDETSF